MAPLKTMLVVLPPGGPPGGFIQAAAKRAAGGGMAIRAVYVLDAVWSRYSGSDWLSTGPSRADFDRYMRETLIACAEAAFKETASECEKAGVSFYPILKEGDPAEVIAEAASETGAGELGIPSSHPSLGAIKRKSRCPAWVYAPPPR